MQDCTTINLDRVLITIALMSWIQEKNDDEIENLTEYDYNGQTYTRKTEFLQQVHIFQKYRNAAVGNLWKQPPQVRMPEQR